MISSIMWHHVNQGHSKLFMKDAACNGITMHVDIHRYMYSVNHHKKLSPSRKFYLESIQPRVKILFPTIIHWLITQCTDMKAGWYLLFYNHYAVSQWKEMSFDMAFWYFNHKNYTFWNWPFRCRCHKYVKNWNNKEIRIYRSYLGFFL